ncbi:hypothetical protein AJ88_38505 [Mesorhizobium amorphae CCBAU 01583]|nr:hypothetical protein AJ88_38505 [Mesorhizobium amorphae CCBAU 01583]
MLEYESHFLNCQTLLLARDDPPVAGAFGSFKFVATPDRLTELLYTMTGKEVPLVRRENESSHHFDPQLFREPEMESFLRRHNALDEQLFELARSGKLSNPAEAWTSPPWRERAHVLALRTKRRLAHW